MSPVLNEISFQNLFSAFIFENKFTKLIWRTWVILETGNAINDNVLLLKPREIKWRIERRREIEARTFRWRAVVRTLLR